MKKLYAIAVAAMLSLLMVSAAQAAQESVTATTTVSARSGSLYQTNPKPANLRIRADVNIPDTELLILPMKNTKITFPKGVSFNPAKSMPVCDDSKLSLQSPLGSP